MSGWSTTRDAVLAAFVAAVAVALTAGTWGKTTMWHPDALFYEAQLLEVRGADAHDARARVFSGPLSAGVSATVHDPKWVAFNQGFYRRRWVVPILGAAVAPAFGTDSLQLVSLAGYALIGPFLFLLLRRRFGVLPGVAAALTCVALPSLRFWAAQPLVDAVAVGLETLALLAAVLVLDRGWSWLALWVPAMAVLAFTKDVTIVVVVATGWVALRQRTIRSAALLATGVAAALPPGLAFGAPLRRSLASVVGGFQVPDDTSWGYIARHYPGAVRGVVDQDFQLLTQRTPVTGLIVVAALTALLVVRRSGDAYFRLVRAALVGAAAMILIQPNPTGLRLELVFVPMLGVGLAAAFDRTLRFTVDTAANRRALRSHG